MERDTREYIARKCGDALKRDYDYERGSGRRRTAPPRRRYGRPTYGDTWQFEEREKEREIGEFYSMEIN